jgi:predicted glycosyltransferase
MEFAPRRHARAAGRKRVLIYSHDTFGLGHLRRSLLIAGQLASLPEVGSILVATGSPRANAFPLPIGCDTIKLPAVTKTPAGEYRPRTLGLPLADLTRIRASLLLSAGRAFRPDVILVDHAPVGMRGELDPLLADLRTWRTPPRVVLGLRDIIDDPDVVRQEWDRVDAWNALERIYDRILVYGDPAILTTAQELGLPETFAGKVRYVGYLGRTIPPHPQARENGKPLILVTAGGGGDGQPLFRAYARFLRTLSSSSFRSLIVTGPLLSSRRQREAVALCEGLGHSVEVIAFTDRFEHVLAQASGVVAMGGYNTVVEILSAGVPALLVPRRTPRREQWIRAQRLSAVADLQFCSVEECDPSRIGRFVARVTGEGHESARSPLRLDGLGRTALEVRRLLAPGSAGREEEEEHRVRTSA